MNFYVVNSCVTIIQVKLQDISSTQCLVFRVLIQLLSPVWLFATPWTAAHQAPLFSTISWSLLKFMSIESVIPSNHLFLCRPLLLPPSIFPSIRVSSNESALCIWWLKYQEMSFLPFYTVHGVLKVFIYLNSFSCSLTLPAL